jgi:hypothetical protein
MKSQLTHSPSSQIAFQGPDVIGHVLGFFKSVRRGDLSRLMHPVDIVVVGWPVGIWLQKNSPPSVQSDQLRLPALVDQLLPVWTNREVAQFTKNDISQIASLNS